MKPSHRIGSTTLFASFEQSAGARFKFFVVCFMGRTSPDHSSVCFVSRHLGKLLFQLNLGKEMALRTTVLCKLFFF